MDEQRKYAILFASTIRCARKLIETMRTLAAGVFQIAATFPMKKLPIGLVKNGLPLDVRELVKQISART